MNYNLNNHYYQYPNNRVQPVPQQQLNNHQNVVNWGWSSGGGEMLSQVIWPEYFIVTPVFSTKDAFADIRFFKMRVDNVQNEIIYFSILGRDNTVIKQDQISQYEDEKQLAKIDIKSIIELILEFPIPGLKSAYLVALIKNNRGRRELCLTGEIEHTVKIIGFPEKTYHNKLSESCDSY
jgi:hypothetical protein